MASKFVGRTWDAALKRRINLTGIDERIQKYLQILDIGRDREGHERMNRLSADKRWTACKVREILFGALAGRFEKVVFPLTRLGWNHYS